MKIKILIAGLFIVFISLGVKGQPLYINPMQYTPNQLVQQVLITGCLQAFNVTYTGDPLSKGYFQSTGTNFAFDAGIILSTGYVLGAVGPNNSGSTSSSTAGVGDPNLNAIIPQTTQDAAVLQFDFIPADNTLTFNFIFGSEEYLEWVNTQYNDVFAFFLTGPNPGPGPNYLNTNIALIPGTPTPVSINNVNNVANNAYYINNGAGGTPNVNQAIQFDGYTVAMAATAQVTACQTYHIKLAIADAIDTALDSGVFLEAGSMVSGEVVSMSNYNPVGDNTTIMEGCENFYVFTRTDTTDLTTPLNILLNISGTANVGSDISGFPVSFSIPIGQVSDTIFYSAFMDNVTEGTEYLIFTLLNGCPCTIGATADTIWVLDNVTLVGGINENDTLICNTNVVTLQLHASYNTDITTTHFLWSTGSTQPTITIQPPVGAITTYSLTITDDCGQYVDDDVVITVSNMSTLTVLPTNLVCNNVCAGSVLVQPDNGFSPYTYSWNPGGLGASTVGTATNLCAGSYSVTATDVYGCVANAPFTITQPPAVTLSFSADSATCPGASDGALEVTIHNGYSPYTISCSTQSTALNWMNAVYTFNNIPAGNYTVNVVDGHGCLAAGIYPVGEMSLSFSTNITNVQCFGESTGSAHIVVNGGTPPYTYEWNNGQATSTLNNVTIGNYSCTVTDAHSCEILVPVTITEPAILTMTNSTDTLMCQGEVATLSAQGYGGTQPYNFVWSDGQNGAVISVTPANTTTYTVYVTDDNNCQSADHEVTVELFPSVSPVFYANIDSICSGETTNLYVDVSGGNGGPYFITDENGEIIIPPMVVSPEESTTYTIFADDDCGSPQGSATLVVNVMNPDPGQFTVDTETGCAPLEVKFTETSPDNGQTYLWDFGDNNDFGYSVAKNPTHLFETPGLFDVSLTVTSAFGCPTSVISQGFINVLPKPDASFYADPNLAYIIRPVVYFKDMSSGIITNLTFNFGDGASQDLGTGTFDDIMHVYSDTGTYVVQMIAENSDGCIDTAFQVIHVVESETFYTPNAINPYSVNAENRVFKPLGYSVGDFDYHLIIYDRWGTKVFESFSFDHGWDGKINGGEIGQAGSYTWVAIYKNYLGAEMRKSGIISIID